jgi:hypothetical protein
MLTMSTTAGFTLSAMAWRLRFSVAEELGWGSVWTGVSAVWEEPVVAPRVSPHPIPMPPLSRTSPARTAASSV